MLASSSATIRIMWCFAMSSQSVAPKTDYNLKKIALYVNCSFGTNHNTGGSCIGSVNYSVDKINLRRTSYWKTDR